METKLKKLLPVAGIVCGLCTSLNAMDNSTQQHNQSMMQHSDETSFRQITPNAGPRVTNGADVFITADFIYWTARQDGMQYAYTGADTVVSPSLVSTIPSKGNTFYPPRKFDPGFKVGLGLNLGHDGWDVFLEYTWFHTNHNNSATSGSLPSQRLIPAYETQYQMSHQHGHFDFELLSFDSMTAKWRLQFNNFDLELGRNYYISQYLTLRPHIGLKGNWYTQNYNVAGFGPWYGDTPFGFGYDYTDTESVTTDMKQKWWGVGIRAGVDASWYFDKNWSIFGEWALSGLWGRFDVTEQGAFVGSITTEEAQTSTVLWSGNSFHSVKGVAEFELGLRFDYWFSDDDYHFGISAGWEIQYWMNQNQMTIPNGDLGFQGLDVKVRFDF